MKIKDPFPVHFFYVKLCVLSILLLAGTYQLHGQPTALSSLGISVIPYPKEVITGGADFVLGPETNVMLDKNASESDRFAADELIRHLQTVTGIRAKLSNRPSTKTIILSRRNPDKKTVNEGYTLKSDKNSVTINAASESGLFYGVQTFIQLIQKRGSEAYIPGLTITDWPDTKVRAVHYDTKHHQDKRSYVESLIRDLAAYKVNMLVWEWEDKFEYPSHPEIGAPGAFTMQEMQDITRYAHKYHIQIVPLVQGLGHVSFILKWPQHAHLREIAASNFEFCPLKEGSYDLLADLWKDAIEATPGSKYIHIGSDETYELGACPACKKKEADIGKSGLYHLFIEKSAKRIASSNRGVMTWEAPMGWAKGRLEVYHTGMKQEKKVTPHKGIILTESYDYETPDLKYAKEAKSLGFPVYAYDPNPGIEQIFLPYFFTKNGKGAIKSGSLENSYNFLQQTMGKDVFDGVIRTSWDDSGLPMQAWMLSFATTAAFAWNAAAPGLPEFTETFFKNRYGPQSLKLDSLYRLLNEGAYFYMESFERRVWAWGEIGKTHLPDLPRGDALEYDPFWNTRYKDRLIASELMLNKMNSAVAICDQNLSGELKNAQDILVFKTLANLVKHTALTYQDLSRIEYAIKAAHQQRFENLPEAYRNLKLAADIGKSQLERRQKVFDEVLSVWGKTMLPKGMSTDTKKYFFEQDRTRHFANRTPDMTYLIVDEQQLGLEDYLVKLAEYNQFFYDRFIK
jgi:hexosaminidase